MPGVPNGAPDASLSGCSSVCRFGDGGLLMVLVLESLDIDCLDPEAECWFWVLVSVLDLASGMLDVPGASSGLWCSAMGLPGALKFAP